MENVSALPFDTEEGEFVEDAGFSLEPVEGWSRATLWAEDCTREELEEFLGIAEKDFDPGATNEELEALALSVPVWVCVHPDDEDDIEDDD